MRVTPVINTDEEENQNFGAIASHEKIKRRGQDSSQKIKSNQTNSGKERRKFNECMEDQDNETKNSVRGSLVPEKSTII